MISNRGKGESLGAEPPARPRAEPDGAREAAARDAPGMRQKQTRTGGREQAAGKGRKRKPFFVAQGGEPYRNWPKGCRVATSTWRLPAYLHIVLH